MRSLAYFAVFLLSLVASAHSTLVYLRVEGANDTIYESRRLIPARAQDTTNGTNPCSGLNGGVNTEPGATCTSALAAAAKTWDFTFDGTYSAELDDFLITRIGDTVQTESQLWGLLLDFQFTPVGGCQQEVQIGQSVLWAFDASSKAYFLDLQTTAEAIMSVGERASFVVKDGATGVAIAGAVVGAVRGGTETATSAADGSVTVTFTMPGMKTFKAERSDSIRSNEVTILVLAPNSPFAKYWV